MSRYLAVCVVLALAGCVRVSETRLPDGGTGYTLRCRDASNCMNKAAELCNGPYQILGGGTSNGFVGGGNVVPVGNTMVMSTYAMPVKRTSMLVACR